MGQVSLDEAVGVFERLRKEHSPVYLSGMGFGWTIGVAGHVSEVSDGAVRFALRGGDEAMALRLDMDDVIFWSGDPAEVPRAVRRGITFLDRAASFVGVVLPYRVAPEILTGPTCDQEQRPRERIFFCELPASDSGVDDRGE